MFQNLVRKKLGSITSDRPYLYYANYKIFFFCDFREPSKIWHAEFEMISVNKIVYMTIGAIIPDA